LNPLKKQGRGRPKENREKNSSFEKSSKKISNKRKAQEPLRKERDDFVKFKQSTTKQKSQPLQINLRSRTVKEIN